MSLDRFGFSLLLVATLIISACGGGDKEDFSAAGSIKNALAENREHLTVSAIGARAGSFDFSQYRLRNSANVENGLSLVSPSACPQAHDYASSGNEWAYAVSCDFWWRNYYDNRGWSHTGADFQVAPDSIDERNFPVLAYGFGKFDSESPSSGRISVAHLLDSGEPIVSNLLHMSGRATWLNGRYVSRYQFLGRENGIGASGLLSFSPHLHLDFSTVPQANIVLDSSAWSQDGRPITSPNFSKDALVAYGTDRIYYDPGAVQARYGELIPTLVSGPYARSDIQVEAAVKIRRQNPKTFDAVGVIVSRCGNPQGVDCRSDRSIRSALADDVQGSKFLVRSWSGTQTADYFGATRSAVVPANTISGSGGQWRGAMIYPEGMYIAEAAVRDGTQDRRGYPILFAITSPLDAIVDNDNVNTGNPSAGQYFNASTQDFNSTIPGYYLTAILKQVRSNSEYVWNVPGDFQFTVGGVEVYIPTSETTNPVIVANDRPESARYAGNSGIRYTLHTRAATYQSDPISPSQTGWVALRFRDANGNVIAFFPDALQLKVLLTDNSQQSTNASIPADHLVAIDAVKFLGTLGSAPISPQPPTPAPTPTPTPGQTVFSTGAYANNANLSQVLTIPGASALSVSITGQTELNYDFISIYDANNNLIRRTSGSLNETVVVQGSSVRVTFTSDSSVTSSGATVRISRVN